MIEKVQYDEEITELENKLNSSFSELKDTIEEIFPYGSYFEKCIDKLLESYHYAKLELDRKQISKNCAKEYSNPENIKKREEFLEGLSSNSVLL